MVHSFFRSIGFSELHKNQELYDILEEVVNDPDEQTIVQDEYGNEFACFSKYTCGDMGISVCGNYQNDEFFRMEYYYPFLRGSQISTKEPVELVKHSYQESYVGMCDELKIGVTLIFHVNNVTDVIREKRFAPNKVFADNIVLSGLSNSGKILLPVMRTKRQSQTREKVIEKRLNLIQQAREGNQAAMESLTISDMDTYSTLSRRIQKEDIFSIVESSFIPYDIESDQYMILGEITDCYKEYNDISEENVWVMSINCNELNFDICINEKDLMGEPEIGRRFRGKIWLQGYLNFGY